MCENQVTYKRVCVRLIVINKLIDQNFKIGAGVKESDKTITTCLYFGKEWRNMKEGVVDMTMRQEVYEKIMRLPEDGIKLILVMADEIARQCGVFIDTDTEKEKSLLLENKKKAFQDMLEMRERSMYPKDFNYKKVMEEAVNEKYNFIN